MGTGLSFRGIKLLSETAHREIGIRRCSTEMKGGAKLWRHRTGEILLDRTRVMGILNVTPDSFSDGGRYFDSEAALRRGLELADEGADILDIGGGWSRAGSGPGCHGRVWGGIDRAGAAGSLTARSAGA